MAQQSRALWQRLGGLLVPNVAHAFTRFPAAVLVAVLLTIFYLFDLDEMFDARIEDNWRPLYAFVAAFLVALTVALSAEAWRPEATSPYTATRVIGMGLCVGLVILSAIFWREIMLMPALAIAGLTILAGIAPFAFTARDDTRLWFVNHEIWIGGIVAALGAGLFGRSEPAARSDQVVHSASWSRLPRAQPSHSVSSVSPRASMQRPHTPTSPPCRITAPSIRSML